MIFLYPFVLLWDSNPPGTLRQDTQRSQSRVSQGHAENTKTPSLVKGLDFLSNFASLNPSLTKVCWRSTEPPSLSEAGVFCPLLLKL